MTSTRHRLGELIAQYSERCGNRNVRHSDISGVNRDKEFFPSKLVGENISNYKVVPFGYFACNLMHVGRDVVLPIAYNNSEHDVFVSPAYTVFSIKEDAPLEPRYLEMWFKSNERDRYFWMHTDSSIRDGMTFYDMCDIEIDLPPIEIQKKYVNIYNAMFSNQVCYERGLEDLKLTCESYIENLRNSSPLVKLEEFCELSDERNEDGICKNVKGLTVYKQFIDTKADMDGVSLTNYKIVNPGDIAYVPTTNRNGDRIACGIAEEQYIVSSTYEVLKINKEVCDPHYLFLWFTRAEMDRYARYNSWGSAREVIAFEDLCSYTIPLPSMKVQQSIANIYKCYLERKKINEQLKEDIKTICPILIKGSLKEANK